MAAGNKGLDAAGEELVMGSAAGDQQPVDGVPSERPHNLVGDMFYGGAHHVWHLSLAALQQGQHLVGIVQLCLCNDCCWHAQALGTHQGVCVWFVTDDEGALHEVGMLEVANEVLAVGATAGNKDSDVYHVYFIEH